MYNGNYAKCISTSIRDTKEIEKKIQKKTFATSDFRMYCMSFGATHELLPAGGVIYE